jgi:dTMP kinase
MREKRCYGDPPPQIELKDLSGILIVIEGADSSGRSSQIRLLSSWLEQRGYAVVQTGLTRSELVGPAITTAKQGNVLSPRTMSLFYATDFYDQLENVIVPALRSGAIALADRYIHTLIARDIVRGAEAEWVDSLYSMAVIPDAVFVLTASPRNLIERALNSYQRLDYWEAGMDIGISRDWYESFMQYQRRLHGEYLKLQKRYPFEVINANRTINAIQRELRARVESVLIDAYGKAGE